MSKRLTGILRPNSCADYNVTTTPSSFNVLVCRLWIPAYNRACKKWGGSRWRLQLRATLQTPYKQLSQRACRVVPLTQRNFQCRIPWTSLPDAVIHNHRLLSDTSHFCRIALLDYSRRAGDLVVSLKGSTPSTLILIMGTHPPPKKKKLILGKSHLLTL